MNKEFIPYEEALALKELGFDEPCFGIFKNKKLIIGCEPNFMPNNTWCSKSRFSDKSNISAPLYQQAFEWFRENYNLHGCIDLHTCTPSHWFVRIDNMITNDYVFHSEDENIKYTTHEEVELACLKKLIEIVKKN